MKFSSFSSVFFFCGEALTLMKDQKKKKYWMCGGEEKKKKTYETNLPEPPKQRSPFVESIQEDPGGRFGSAQEAGKQH